MLPNCQVGRITSVYSLLPRPIRSRKDGGRSDCLMVNKNQPNQRPGALSHLRGEVTHIVRTIKIPGFSLVPASSSTGFHCPLLQCPCEHPLASSRLTHRVPNGTEHTGGAGYVAVGFGSITSHEQNRTKCDATFRKVSIGRSAAVKGSAAGS